MTVIDKKMNLEQYDIMALRLEQARSVILALAAGNDDHCSALYGPAELLSQAEDALKGLFVESEAV